MRSAWGQGLTEMALVESSHQWPRRHVLLNPSRAIQTAQCLPQSSDTFISLPPRTHFLSSSVVLKESGWSLETLHKRNRTNCDHCGWSFQATRMCLISPPIFWDCTFLLRRGDEGGFKFSIKKIFFSALRIKSGPRDILLRRGNDARPHHVHKDTTKPLSFLI